MSIYHHASDCNTSAPEIKQTGPSAAFKNFPHRILIIPVAATGNPKRCGLNLNPESLLNQAYFSRYSRLGYERTATLFARDKPPVAEFLQRMMDNRKKNPTLSVIA
jgi:hypothetical protein